MTNIIARISFWVTVMRDHTDFFLRGLSGKEEELIKNTEYFKDSWNSIENELSKIMDKTIQSLSPTLINNIYSTLVDFINFKEYLLKQSLICKIEINIPPTFLNHTINEANEFYRELDILHTNTRLNATEENTHLHKIWLLDNYGHADSIDFGLDFSEKELKEEARSFSKVFNDLYLKNVELTGMMERTKLHDNTLDEFNNTVEENINKFILYLEKIRKLKEECKIMGTLTPLIPDHMIREAKYYLSRLKEIQNIKLP